MRTGTGSRGHAPSYDELLLDRQLCFALHAASRAVVRAYGPVLEELGLTYPQYVTMLALWERPDEARTVGELVEAVRTDTGTLTPLLKRLERDGLVSRARDPHDERRVLVRLTPAGLALRDRAVAVPRAIGALVGMSADEARRLKDQLEQLVRTLDAAAATRAEPAARDAAS